MLNQPFTPAFDDGGQGSVPIVFLHALGGNRSHWNAALLPLRTSRQAVALSWPVSAPVNFTIPTVAKKVAEEISTGVLAPYILVGHSAGATLALEIAGQFPSQVAGLYLVDPPGDFRQVPEAEIAPFFAALASPAYAATIAGYYLSQMSDSIPAVQTRVLTDLRNTPPEIVNGMLSALRKYDPLPALQRYPGPRHALITPANDSPVSLHRLVPDLPYSLLAGTGHWLMLDRPDRFQSHLSHFIQEVERSLMPAFAAASARIVEPISPSQMLRPES